MRSSEGGGAHKFSHWGRVKSSLRHETCENSGRAINRVRVEARRAIGKIFLREKRELRECERELRTRKLTHSYCFTTVKIRLFNKFILITFAFHIQGLL